MTKFVQLVSNEVTEKVNEIIGYSQENDWSEEDLYYVAKVLLALFKDD